MLVVREVAFSWVVVSGIAVDGVVVVVVVGGGGGEAVVWCGWCGCGCWC